MSKFLNMTSEEFLIEYEKLNKQLINSENQRKMLADEVEKLKSSNNDLFKKYCQSTKDKNELLNKLEQQKELVELGEALELFYKKYPDQYMDKDKHELIEWYRQQKEGK